MHPAPTESKTPVGGTHTRKRCVLSVHLWIRGCVPFWVTGMRVSVVCIIAGITIQIHNAIRI